MNVDVALQRNESLHKPFLALSNTEPENDWTFHLAHSTRNDELRQAREIHAALSNPLKVLVLYGSNRAM